MVDSVYKVVELVGSSSQSWDQAAKVAVERAGKSLRDLRVATVTEKDLVINNGKVEAYRVKLKVSFKFEGEGSAKSQSGGARSAQGSKAPQSR